MKESTHMEDTVISNGPIEFGEDRFNELEHSSEVLLQLVIDIVDNECLSFISKANMEVGDCTGVII